MRSALTAVCTAGVLLGLAGHAVAATITGKVRSNNQGTEHGTMEFRAGKGVRNHLVVRPERNRDPGNRISTYLVTERAERLKASGACKQVNRHTARCPRTEDSILVEIVLRDRADRVEVERCRAQFECTVGVRARGGSGDDVLTGGGEFHGDGGDDVLRGLTRGRSGDTFYGGPGRDLMVGHGTRQSLDFFYDDETDAQAARDIIRGGTNARAFLDYSMRERDLRIDLRDERQGPERDRVSGVKNVTTGAGDDVLRGTGGQNRLAGGGGNDLLDGRGGTDTLGGGDGDDRLLGGDGGDFLEPISALYTSEEPSLTGPSGSDRLVGGQGADEARSLDTSEPDGEIWPDEVECDGEDRLIMSDPLDLLHACDRIAAWSDADPFEMVVVPELTDEGAVFTLQCAPTEFDQSGGASCRGELVLTSTAGVEYGRQGFEFQRDTAPPFEWPDATVTVPLSETGRAAIEANEVIQVQVNAFSSSGFRFPPAGYRARLGAT